MSTDLRILHIVEDFSSKNTGITSTISQLAAWQIAQGVGVGVYSTGKPDVVSELGVNLFWDEDFRFPSSWRCPCRLAEHLEFLIREQGFSVLHLHGFWRAAPWVAQKVASHMGIATVLTVHGQVESWAWHGQGLVKTCKKNIYWHLCGRRVFEQVSLLHAITEQERDNLRNLLSDNHVVTIPNALDLTSFSCSEACCIPGRNLLFLGRIHPVKRIDWLLDAFAEAKLHDAWRLIIAGPEEDADYARRLRCQAERLGLLERVSFVGSVYGLAKKRLLRDAWVVAVPSFSEVIGMVNLESAACGTPTITTRQTGLFDWEQGGGVLIDSGNSSALSTALKKATMWTESERLERGCRMRHFVESRYSMDVVGQQWLDAYNGLLEKKA